jgi:ubiquinone/menaquinone biosynthesis C-methylase UbiE
MTIPAAQDKQKEIDFFDAHAAKDEYDVFTPDSNARLIAAIIRVLALQRGARLADLGCGSGVFTQLLLCAGYSTIGLDISPQLIQLGREKHSGLELIEGDAENLPFDNESMDGVFAELHRTPFSRPPSVSQRGPPCSQTWWSFRSRRSQSHESVHVDLS